MKDVFYDPERTEENREGMDALAFLRQAYMLEQQIQTKLHQISSLRSLPGMIRSAIQGMLRPCRIP